MTALHGRAVRFDVPAADPDRARKLGAEIIESIPATGPGGCPATTGDSGGNKDRPALDGRSSRPGSKRRNP